MTEVIKDQLNVVELIDLQCSMMAVEDKIIILVDEYKSGFECKTCGGTGKVPSSVVEGAMKDCTAQGCVKGALLVIPDTAKSLPSTGVVMSMGPQTQCMINNLRLKNIEKTLIKVTGTEDYDFYLDQKAEILADIERTLIQIGTRVVFGVHVGTKIPIKGNIKLVVMREKEPLCVVFGNSIDDKALIDYSAVETY